MVTKRKRDDFIPEGMKHSDFSIGCEFLTATGRWRCTDVGTRTIAAIKLEYDGDPGAYNGPPYGIVEHVFDEDGIEGCSPASGNRKYDNSGARHIVVKR
jgi:hypothetical protein